MVPPRMIPRILGVCVLMVLALSVHSVAQARTLSLIGVRQGQPPQIRLLYRKAKTAFQYWSLGVVEVQVGNDDAKTTPLVSRRTAFRRQKAGLFERHRRDLIQKEREVTDQAQLEKFLSPRRLTCTDSVILVGSEARLFPANKGSVHYAEQCVLRTEDGRFQARLLMRILKGQTEISFATPASAALSKVTEITHLALRLRHRGEVSRPVRGLHQAWVAFPDEPSRTFFVLVWDYVTPHLPDIMHQQTMTVVSRKTAGDRWEARSY